MAKKKAADGGGSQLWLGAAAAAAAVAAVAFVALSAGEDAPKEAPAASAAAGPVQLSVADNLAQLNKEVFSKDGETAWLVWCKDSIRAAPDGTTPYAMMEALAPELVNVASVGMLDCTSTLPSGKTVYEKLGLDEEQKPAIFLSPQQGKKPSQLPLSKISTASLATIARKATRPKLRQVESDTVLVSHCLVKDWCALILHRGEALSESHAADAAALVEALGRQVSFTALDASAFRLSTSPKVVNKGEPKADTPVVVLFRRGAAGLSAAVDRSGNLTDTGEAAEMIRKALGAGSAASLPLILKQTPTLVDKGEAKSAAREERKAKRQQELKAEEVASAKRAEERRRREQMDREAEELAGIQDAGGDDLAGEDTGAASEEEQQEAEEEEEGMVLDEAAEGDEDDDDEVVTDEEEEEVVLDDDE